jgi:hypothetical protein
VETTISSTMCIGIRSHPLVQVLEEGATAQPNALGHFHHVRTARRLALLGLQPALNAVQIAEALFPA